MRKQVIGLTGHFASGKTTVAEIFKEHNYLVIEVDDLGHKALKQKTNEIIKTFGTNILDDENKEIDRKKLGKIVFENKAKLKILESIVHPAMKKEVTNIIANTKYNKILISAAILIEMTLNTICNYNILVWTPLNAIIQRASKRNKLNKKQTLNILKNQLPLKNRLKFVDYVLRNDGTYDTLYERTKKLISLGEKDISA